MEGLEQQTNEQIQTLYAKILKQEKLKRKVNETNFLEKLKLGGYQNKGIL